MKCVSASRTSAETELAIFPPRRKLWSGWSDSANSTLHSVWSIRHDPRWPRYVCCQSTAVQSRLERNKRKVCFQQAESPPPEGVRGLLPCPHTNCWCAGVLAVGVFLLYS